MGEKSVKHHFNGANNDSNSVADNQGKKIKFNIMELVLISIFTIVLTLFFTIVISFIPIAFNYAKSRMETISLTKPIIYLYPNVETNVEVKLEKPNIVTCSYPKYEGAWNVIAKPNGDLVDLKNGRNLYSLYWEGKSSSKKEIIEGFCVKGKDSAKFLEEKLDILGLSDREAEEFIVYWLPILELNKYNLISFETMEEINNDMPLTITPTPDSLIRVMMKFKSVDLYVEIPEQRLETPQRTGFVAVEWGGIEIK